MKTGKYSLMLLVVCFYNRSYCQLHKWPLDRRTISSNPVPIYPSPSPFHPILTPPNLQRSAAIHALPYERGQFENGCEVWMMRRAKAGVQLEDGSSEEEWIARKRGNLIGGFTSSLVRKRHKQSAMQPFRMEGFQTWGQLNRSRERHTEEMHRAGNV